MNGTCCDDDTLIIQRGDCIDVLVQYKNEDGTSIDLTGRGVEVAASSHPTTFMPVEVTITDHVRGMVSVHLARDQVNQLPYGRASWFRLATWLLSEDEGDGEPVPMIFEHVHDITSPKIWVKIK